MLNGAGTLGCLVKRKNRIVGLTNTHVVGMLYDPDYAQPSAGFSDLMGVQVTQPSKEDGGSLYTDTVGNAYKAIPLRFGIDAPVNYVDAATVSFTGKNNIWFDILEVTGGPYDFGETYAGEIITKSSRTTQLTYGTVVDTNVDLAVYYNNSEEDKDTAYFTNQVLTEGTDHSAAGDSGSVIVRDTTIVGLVFGGTADGVYAISNPINRVAELLDLVPWDGSIVLPLSDQEEYTYNGRLYRRKGTVRKPIQVGDQ